MKLYVVLRQLFRFCLYLGKKLVKLHWKICFQSLYVPRYIVNNTAKRQKFNQYNVNKRFYKRKHIEPNVMTIGNVARQINIRLLNDMVITRRWLTSNTVLTFSYLLNRWRCQKFKFRLRLQKYCNIRRRWYRLKCVSLQTLSTCFLLMASSCLSITS